MGQITMVTTMYAQTASENVNFTWLTTHVALCTCFHSNLHEFIMSSVSTLVHASTEHEKLLKCLMLCWA